MNASWTTVGGDLAQLFAAASELSPLAAAIDAIGIAAPAAADGGAAAAVAETLRVVQLTDHVLGGARRAFVLLEPRVAFRGPRLEHRRRDVRVARAARRLDDRRLRV